MNRYYVERNCGHDIVRDRLNDDKPLTAYEIVKLLNNEKISPKIGRELHVYTDGSCNVSERIGGWAIVSKEFTASGRKQDTTNNEMELYAILKAIEHGQAGNYSKVHIYTDSEYALKTLTEWAYKWESKGWKKKGGVIRNLELIKEIFSVVKDNDRFVFHKVKAHDGVKYNEQADKLAKSCCDKG